MAAIVTNPTPGVRFRGAAENIRKHRDLVGSEEFERACDYAMLNYTLKVSADAKPDMAGAAAGFFRVLGAQEFLKELRMLAETPPQAPVRRDTDNLTS